MDFERHRREMLAHCVKLAQIDKAYAWWAAKRYARESEGVLSDLPQLLTAEMKRNQSLEASVPELHPETNDQKEQDEK